jgi:hypothetical protein
MITKLNTFINESKISFEKIFNNPIFIKAFNGSKVVDNNNNPLLMHHGGSFSGGEFKGNGWFTISKKDAKYYAKQNNGFVTSAFLIIKNPLYSGDIKHLNIKITPEILKTCKKINYNIKTKNDIIQFIEANSAVIIAQNNGYDGVIDIHEKEILDAVIFDNNQLLLPENFI